MPPDELAEHGLDLRLVLLAQLRLPGRDPDRCRGPVVGQPDPFVRERAVHVETPPAAVLLEAPLGVGKGPAPGRVVVEREGEDLGDLRGLGLGHSAHGQRPSRGPRAVA